MWTQQIVGSSQRVGESGPSLLVDRAGAQFASIFDVLDAARLARSRAIFGSPAIPAPAATSRAPLKLPSAPVELPRARSSNPLFENRPRAVTGVILGAAGLATLGASLTGCSVPVRPADASRTEETSRVQVTESSLRVRQPGWVTEQGQIERSTARAPSNTFAFQTIGVSMQSDGSLLLQLSGRSAVKSVQITREGKVSDGLDQRSVFDTLGAIFDQSRTVIDAENREHLETQRIAASTLGSSSHPVDMPIARAADFVRRFEAERIANAQLMGLAEAPSNPAEGLVYRVGHIDPAQRAHAVTAIQAELGVAPLRWTGYINEHRELGVAQAFLDAARPDLGVRASFLYSVALGEGLGYMHLDRVSSVDGVDTLQRVSGFSALGTDTFGSSASRLRARGYLPSEFQEGTHYWVRERTNEHGDRVQSADFVDLDSALVALSAMLADYRAMALRDIDQVLGPTVRRSMSEEQIEFFTYVYFNAGPGFGRRMVEQEGLLYFKPWEGVAPTNNRNARYNALLRIAHVRLTDTLGLFP